jgi:hypothetical protein
MILQITRITLASAMMGYAAFKDIRTREVHDLNWIIFGGCGVMLDIYQLATGSLDWRIALLSLAVAGFFALFAWNTDLFGEADLLALIALTLIHPITPRIPRQLALPGLLFPLTVLTNSALIGASTAFIVFLRNLWTGITGPPLFKGHESESALRKVGIMFTGTLTRVESLRGPPFQYPLERFEGDSSRKLVVTPNITDDEMANSIFEGFNERDLEWIWVSKTLPFLAIMLGGYLTSLILGDIILSLLVVLLT